MINNQMKCCSCKKKLSIRVLPKNTIEICLACGRDMLSVSKRGFICDECPEFRVCKECKLCPAKHHMKKVYILHRTSGPYGGGYSCDVCGKSGNKGETGTWHCTPCEYDICPKCEFQAN